MYFLSALDPNYRIKGSRDPLGFQSLWAAAGHKAIRHLSTVSSNLRDFMILCYAHYFFGDRDTKDFIRFFIRFEQLFAYARYYHNHETAFNGTEYISKKAEDPEFFISLKDTILSNQRVYGIWGKYIRPLRDMGITEDPDFKAIIENSLQKTNINEAQILINKLLNAGDERIKVSKNELLPIADLIKTVTNQEHALFKKYILKVPGEDHPQNNLYEVISNNKDIVTTHFQLHQSIQSLLNKSETDDALKAALINIDNTDRVLHPLNLVFTHLLSQTSWSIHEIEKETLFNQLPVKLNYDFQDETMRILNESMGLPAVELVKELVKRNEEVSKSRGNKSWIEEDKKIFRVLYRETGKKITEINTETGFEFTYFLNNYFGLYKQIEMV